jgi:four helix bundle protein
MAAESRNDFIHKLKIILKELRETFVCLKIIKHKPLITPFSKFESAYNENNELIAIFVKSIQTAKTNQKKKN